MKCAAESGNNITTKTALGVVHTHSISLNRKEAVSGNCSQPLAFFMRLSDEHRIRNRKRLFYSIHQRDAGFVNLLRGSGADRGGVVGVSLQLIVDFVAFSL